MKIRIWIEGQQGTGKTIVAQQIASLLHNAGISAMVDGAEWKQETAPRPLADVPARSVEILTTTMEVLWH